MGLLEVKLSLQRPLFSLEVDVPNPNSGLVFLVTSRPHPKAVDGSSSSDILSVNSGGLKWTVLGNKGGFAF